MESAILAYILHKRVSSVCVCVSGAHTIVVGRHSHEYYVLNFLTCRCTSVHLELVASSPVNAILTFNSLKVLRDFQ